MDQIMNEAAKIRYRSNNDFACPIVIRVPFGGGIHGALYHSQSIEAMFVHTPGLQGRRAGDSGRREGLLRAAIRDPDPVLYLEHKKMYRAIKGEVPDGDYEVPIGKARIVQEGTDVTIIAYGLMVHESLKAAADGGAGDRGEHRADRSALAQATRRRTVLVHRRRRPARSLVVTEANAACSVASEVAAMIGEQAFAYLDAPVMRVAAPDVPAMPFSPPLGSTPSWSTPRRSAARRCAGLLVPGLSV